MAISAPTKKPVILAPIQPNAGIEAAYRRKLNGLIEEMHKSVVYWLTAKYRNNPPEMAQDDSPAMVMRNALKELAKRWQKNFDDAALEMAKHFSTKATDRADGALANILKKSGFSVRFKFTAEANDVLQATIGEQVGLIKSISSEYLTEVEGLVMRSITKGRDLESLTKELLKRYQLTKKRAAFIARDQNNKATASINRVRQKELGIKTAIWMHSHAGKHPRSSHVAANGKSYDVDKGMLIDGEYIFPGEMINCRCVSKSVIPGF